MKKLLLKFLTDWESAINQNDIPDGKTALHLRFYESNTQTLKHLIK